MELTFAHLQKAEMILTGTDKEFPGATKAM